jgi:hypothetical protein
MSKENTLRYRYLISDAKQAEYYASVTTGSARERWAAKAQELRLAAAELPDDFVDPPFQMPAWGTYGT